MIETSGFYSVDGVELLYAPNAVYGPYGAYTLLRQDQNSYEYPAHGWYWFDSEALAREFFELPEPDNEAE
jgi:hypothetical protein